MVYGQPFGVDVAFGDPMFGEIDIVTGDDLLGFAGIPPPSLRVYPVETHLAEKLHAYTLPRQRPNSRVKDLPDLALLGTIRPLEARGVRAALERAFAFRRVQPLPKRLPAPPIAWAAPYARMADENGLQWRTLSEVESAARTFLDPILTGVAEGRWDPVSWQWGKASR
jgi:hypothetical protein